ncbi:hypothetical protein BX616_005173, partial [Lobosporangium transversale]
MIPYFPAVYIGPNGEQFPGYASPQMGLPYEQQQQQYHHSQQHPHSHSRQQHPRSSIPSHQHPHHPHPPQYPSHQHHHPRPQQQHPHSHHTQGQGQVPIHGPTSTPLSFSGTAAPKPTHLSEQSTSMVIATPDMQQFESSVRMESIGSPNLSGSSSGDKSDQEGGKHNLRRNTSTEKISTEINTSIASAGSGSKRSGDNGHHRVNSNLQLRIVPEKNHGLAPPTTKKSTASSNRTGPHQTSQRPNRLPNNSLNSRSQSTAVSTTTTSPITTTSTVKGMSSTDSSSMVPDTGSDADSQSINNVSHASERKHREERNSNGTEQKEQERKQIKDDGHNKDNADDGPNTTILPEPHWSPSVSSSTTSQQQQQQQQQQPFMPYHSPYPGLPQSSSHSNTSPFVSPYPHRSNPTPPYYPARQMPGQSKPYSGQQGQGPGGVHGPMPLIPGPGHPSDQGTHPPGSNPVSVSGGANGSNAIGTSSTGAGPVAGPVAGPGQSYSGPGGFNKPPYPGHGFPPPDYSQHPGGGGGGGPGAGYYMTAEGWRPISANNAGPALQKKPKELDKAMWVGNVLNDTTVEELEAIFQAEPSEAEGDIQHDIPESIFILPKSNCAFVNYSSHEAVDRAVRRFHDREFKNTRLVCRPRKDPASSESGSNRFQQHQQHIHQSRHYPHHPHLPHTPYLPDNGMVYYSPDPQVMFAQHMDSKPLDDSNAPSLSVPRHYNRQQHPHPHQPHRNALENQARIERAHVGRSSMSDSNSGVGIDIIDMSITERELSPTTNKPGSNSSSKKARSPSASKDYAEARYFILKSLNEEDLKLSVQYGLWATQEHLVPILNEAFA